MQRDRSVLVDLVRRVTSPPYQARPEAPIVAPAVIPYWTAERGSGLAALAAGTGTDWDDAWIAPGVTLYKFLIPTIDGYLNLVGDTTTYPVRAIIQWDSPVEYAVTGILHTGVKIQMKMNGKLSYYTATSALTLNVRKGRNILRVAHDGTAGTATLEIQLFGSGSTWARPG